MNFEDNIKQLQAAQGNSDKLAQITVEIVLAALNPVLRPALEAAAVPHWFDTEILTALLNNDAGSAEKVLKELYSLSMVESFATRNGWNVNKTMRIALRRRLARQQPQRMHELSARAANHFEGDDPPKRIEAIYHRLVAFPEHAAKELDDFYYDWSSGSSAEVLQTLVMALDELVMDGLLEPLARATVLLFFCRVRGTRGVEDHAREAARVFFELAKPAAEVEARYHLGDILKAQGRRDEALLEFEACKEIILRQLAPYQISVLAPCLLREKELRETYDVFLSYNSKDKEAVISIASNLGQVGLRPWLDEWDLIRSQPWMPQIVKALKMVNCAAVFVGQNGTGPWQEKEQETALRMAVNGDKGIVVVLLPDAVEDPDALDGLLGSYPVISLRGREKTEPASFSNLVLGIMGEKPGDLRERAVDAALVAEVQARRRTGPQH